MTKFTDKDARFLFNYFGLGLTNIDEVPPMVKRRLLDICDRLQSNSELDPDVVRAAEMQVRLG